MSRRRWELGWISYCVIQCVSHCVIQCVSHWLGRGNSKTDKNSGGAWWERSRYLCSQTISHQQRLSLLHLLWHQSSGLVPWSKELKWQARREYNVLEKRSAMTVIKHWLKSCVPWLSVARYELFFYRKQFLLFRYKSRLLPDPFFFPFLSFLF